MRANMLPKRIQIKNNNTFTKKSLKHPTINKIIKSTELKTSNQIQQCINQINSKVSKKFMPITVKSN